MWKDRVLHFVYDVSLVWGANLTRPPHLCVTALPPEELLFSGHSDIDCALWITYLWSCSILRSAASHTLQHMDYPQKVSHKASQNCMSSCVTLPLCRGQHFRVYRTCGAWYRAPPCCLWGMGWRTGGHQGRESTPKVPAGHPESQSFPPSITLAGINPTCAAKVKRNGWSLSSRMHPPCSSMKLEESDVFLHIMLSCLL